MAVEILKEAKQLHSCKDIIRAIFDQMLAESGGRTTRATLSAAIGRELSNKGKDSRFKQEDHGEALLEFITGRKCGLHQPFLTEGVHDRMLEAVARCSGPAAIIKSSF